MWFFIDTAVALDVNTVSTIAEKRCMFQARKLGYVKVWTSFGLLGERLIFTELVASEEKIVFERKKIFILQKAVTLRKFG